MKEKIYQIEKGPIHYWFSSAANEKLSLVFLPGLTADHRLFEKQIDHFDGKYRIFVWDAYEKSATISRLPMTSMVLSQDMRSA